MILLFFDWDFSFLFYFSLLRQQTNGARFRNFNVKKHVCEIVRLLQVPHPVIFKAIKKFKKVDHEEDRLTEKRQKKKTEHFLKPTIYSEMPISKSSVVYEKNREVDRDCS